MWAIFAFLEKRPLTEVVVKFSKLCSESFTASPIDVLFKCRNICPTENRWNRRYLRTNKKKFGCLSNCRYCVDRAQNMSGPARNNVLTVLQISYKSAHFRRSYSRTREHRELWHDKHHRRREWDLLPVPADVHSTAKGERGLISKHVHCQLVRCNLYKFSSPYL